MRVYNPLKNSWSYEDIKLPLRTHSENLVVVPSFFDMHTHVRLNGGEDYDSLEKAAIAGGFSQVLIQPNTDPLLDTSETHALHEKLSARKKVTFYRTTSLFGKAKPDGKKILCYSTDGISYSYRDLVNAFRSQRKALVMDHSQMHEFEGIFYEGTRTELPRRPITNEAVAIYRTVMTGVEYGFCKFHIQHVSTKPALELISFLKKTFQLTCEVTPHHLLLSNELIDTVNKKVNPPLADVKTIESLRDAVKNGVIDVLATDHAPHFTKDQDMKFAAFGTSNIEIAFSAFFTALQDLPLVVEKLSITPRKILNIPYTFDSENFVVLDLNHEFEVRSKDFFSKGKNCAMEGMKLKGRVLGTKLHGKLVYWDGEFLC